MTEKYDLNKAAEEASEMKSRLADIERTLAYSEGYFLRICHQYTDDYFDLPPELREKIVLAMVPPSLDELRKQYQIFVENPGIKSYDEMLGHIQHNFLKVGVSAGKIDKFEDVSADYKKCYRLSGDSEREPGQSSYDPNNPNESDEEFLERTKPSLDKLTAQIEHILEKYGKDPRFSHDPYKLVAEIREDFAKYKAERFPTK